jgi:ligand-binding sensor domain-containing protein
MARLPSRIAGIALTVLALLPTPAAALDQKPLATYSREIWSTRDGLPHNQVNSIAQSREGYLWFATWDGLVRYNGQEFRTYGRANTPA